MKKMNNKKIIIVTECFYPEQFNINELAFAWKDMGYDVDVLTLFPSYPAGKILPGYKNRFFGKEIYNGINIYRVFAITGYKDNKFKKLLKYINFMIFGSILAALIGRKYDYIFGFNVGALTDMVPAVVIKKLYRKPLMFWVQDVWPDSIYAYGFKKTRVLSGFLNSFVKFMFNNVTSIAISGKGFENKLRPYVKKNINFNYLPNWAIKLNNNIEEIKLSDETRVHFTFAGNIGKVQNLENIIRAFNMLSNEYQSKAQLNIIGDGSSLNELKEMSLLNKNIVFYGLKKTKEMAKFYKASDFLIVSLIDIPIFSVTVPAKTQTYIAAKKPILAIINGDTADIIRNNNLGLCVNPSDLGLIHDTFQDCINMNESEKMAFVRNNDQLLNQLFNKDKIINNLTKILVQ
jgi:glycosyltransferase involved in cell wall biosynthesis